MKLHLCNQKLNHVPHTLLNQLVYLGVELFLWKAEEFPTKVFTSAN